MKKLIAITAIGLSVGLSNLSLATEHMELYTNTPAKSEVQNEIRGGYIETDLMSLYTIPKKENTVTSQTAKAVSSDDNSYTVFGVKVSARPQI